MRRLERLALPLALLATAALFLPALRFGFVYDDTAQIVENPNLVADDALWRALTQDLWSFAPDSAEARYWRPTFSVWLILGRSIFDLNPKAWHIATLAAHGAALAAAWALARSLGAGALPAALGALLFAIHPSRAESAAWLSGAPDPLAAALGLSACALWSGGLRRVLASGLFALALGCKESAVVFAAWPLLHGALGLSAAPEAVAMRERLRRALPPALPWAALALAFLLLRALVLDVPGRPTTPTAAGSAVLTLPVLLAEYTRLLFHPDELSVLSQVRMAQGVSDPSVLGAAPLALAGLAGLAAFFRYSGPARPLVALGALLLLPALRPSALQPDMLTQARYLYLPMACWAPAAAWALHLRLTTRATAAVHAALVLAVLLSAVGLHANLPPWSSDLALWTRATQVRPDSGRAWFNLGTVHENAGRLADAETCYTRAVQAEPERAIFHFRRAFMLAERSALDDARREFRRAAELRPGDPMFLYEAGRIEGAVGDPREAARLLDEAAAALARGVRPGGGVSAEKIQAEREALGRRSGTSR